MTHFIGLFVQRIDQDLFDSFFSYITSVLFFLLYSIFTQYYILVYMYVSPKTDQSLVITESSCKIAHKCKKVTTLNCNVQLFCTTTKLLLF